MNLLCESQAPAGRPKNTRRFIPDRPKTGHISIRPTRHLLCFELMVLPAYPKLRTSKHRLLASEPKTAKYSAGMALRRIFKSANSVTGGACSRFVGCPAQRLIADGLLVLLLFCADASWAQTNGEP